MVLEKMTEGAVGDYCCRNSRPGFPLAMALNQYGTHVPTAPTVLPSVRFGGALRNGDGQISKFSDRLRLNSGQMKHCFGLVADKHFPLLGLFLVFARWLRLN